ncbi:Fe-S cluster assembly protein HesB [Bacillus sp. V3-13]|uniref:3-hexulose-6-phosphate synthase n=1 Tax=Bacillus sp. V3-13 TaxID=2053728 RepID=UPI000C7744BF|nr:3-hexulose-6-phosphate synthase [Bacillus sp. V3-13]PLR76772.1 Fe-S cluster assembly protein HesB [Bacillus sp. V3-13]
MYLQLALDRVTREKCFQIVKETESAIDWIEIGTGVIKEYGMAIVRDMKAAYPHKTIVADMKTCDAGKHETRQAFEAGADISTVMAFCADQTIKDSLEVAKYYGKKIMVDLLGVTDGCRIHKLLDMGVELICLHHGKDLQKQTKLHKNSFAVADDVKGVMVSVAGGITMANLPDILEKNPDIVIVGSGITKTADRGKTARDIKEKLIK